tara:strand:+ start:1137 stop:1304 length:168 start_codon:yes stop_codon:yes gene_type:complete
MPGHTGAKKKKNKKMPKMGGKMMGGGATKKNKKMPKMGGGYKRGGKVTKSRGKKK